MSIIIRLQNLPWDASAINIRQFFQGLSIPSGGVHIVGGDKGDAFIAFSTDEDARLAMGKNGEMIGSSMIKLFLSSKTEMQNVINQARKSSDEVTQLPSNSSFSGLNQGTMDNFKNPLLSKPVVNNFMGKDFFNRHPDNNFNNSSNNMYDNRSDFHGSNAKFQLPNKPLGYTSLDFSINSYKNQDPFSMESKNKPNPIGNKFINNNNDLFNKDNGPMFLNKGINNYAPINEMNPMMSQKDSLVRPGNGFPNSNQSWTFGFDNNQNNNQYSGELTMQSRIQDDGYKKTHNLNSNIGVQSNLDNKFPMGQRISETNNPNWGDQSKMITNMNSIRKSYDMEHHLQNIQTPSKHFLSMDNISANSNMKHIDSHGLKRQAPLIDDYCIHIENLPITFNYREIRSFLIGCEINMEGIKIINNEYGKRTGRAYIRFRNRKSLEMALRKDKTIINGCKVDIEECTEHDFTNAVDSYHPTRARSISPKHKADLDYCIIIKKLPLNYTVKDIKKLLGNVRYASNGGPHIERTRAGKSMGNALVELERRRDYDDILQMHRMKVKNEPIHVIAISQKEYETRIKTSEAFALIDDGQIIQEHYREAPRICVMMRGLPYEANIPTIKDFFRGISIVDGGIHVVLDSSNRPSGIAYVEFLTESDCIKAKQKDKEYIGRRYIDIIRVTKQEMLDELSLNRKHLRLSSEKVSETYVYMRNLNEKTQLDDIMSFFRGYHPILDSIKLQYKDDKPTGDGLVAFSSRKEAEDVIENCYKKLLLGRYIDLELWDN